jgi:hypothetical protein
MVDLMSLDPTLYAAMSCRSLRSANNLPVIGPFLSPFLQQRSKRLPRGHRRHLLRKIMNKAIATTELASFV